MASSTNGGAGEEDKTTGGNEVKESMVLEGYLGQCLSNKSIISHLGGGGENMLGHFSKHNFYFRIVFHLHENNGVSTQCPYTPHPVSPIISILY